MTQTQTPRRQAIPAWLAVLVILLAIGGGGWFVYDRIFAESDEVALDSIPVDPGFRRSPVEARPTLASRWGFGGPPEGIMKRGTGPITVRRGDAYLRAVPNKTSHTISFDYLSSVRQSWMTPAQWDLHLLAMRVLDNAELGKQLNITADQKQKLQGLSYAVPLTAAERSSLEAMVRDWDKATGAEKDPAGMKLLEAVAKIGTAHLAETKSAMLKRVQQIPSILTAQQIAQGKAPAPAPAATRPVAPTTRPSR